MVDDGDGGSGARDNDVVMTHEHEQSSETDAALATATDYAPTFAYYEHVRGSRAALLYTAMDEFQPSSNFTKGVRVSPDGLCMLTNSDDNVLRLFEMHDSAPDATNNVRHTLNHCLQLDSCSHSRSMTDVDAPDERRRRSVRLRVVPVHELERTRVVYLCEHEPRHTDPHVGRLHWRRTYQYTLCSYTSCLMYELSHKVVTCIT